MFPNMLISILLFYLTIYSIHFLEFIKIRLTLNQHNLFDLTCMDVLKTGNLLTVTDACLNYRLLVFFIISLCNCLSLK